MFHWGLLSLRLSLSRKNKERALIMFRGRQLKKLKRKGRKLSSSYALLFYSPIALSSTLTTPPCDSTNLSFHDNPLAKNRSSNSSTTFTLLPFLIHLHHAKITTHHIILLPHNTIITHHLLSSFVISSS